MSKNFQIRRVGLSIACVAICLCGIVNAQGQLTLTLTPSDFNGYSIQCFGGKSGSIDLTVGGGTAPYTYLWTSGDTIEDLTGLPAGYYRVSVFDVNNLMGDGSITLKEPEALKVLAEPFKYPNGANISCHDCYNGSIDVTVAYGVGPYSYNWGDGVLTQDRSGLGAQSYTVKVTDDNGCVEGSKPVFLKQPDSDDWKKGGNANTDPNSQYIGTSDNTDVVFKSNSNELLRLKSDGTIKLGGTISGTGPLQVDEGGVLRGGGFPNYGPMYPPILCRTLDFFPYWETRGNSFPELCPGSEPLLGTLDNVKLPIVTNGEQRMVFHTNGKVGIGTNPSAGAIVGYRLFVEDGIACRDVLVKPGPWPDFVFEEAYHLMPLTELKAYLKSYKHLPGIPSAGDVATKGGIELGDMQTQVVRVMEEQALYILQLKDELDELKARVQTLEATK